MKNIYFLTNSDKKYREKIIEFMVQVKDYNISILGSILIAG